MRRFFLFLLLVFCSYAYTQISIPWGVYPNSNESDFQGNIRVQDTIGVGFLYINDNFYFPSTDGTDGQAMITDGSGQVTWKNVANDNDVEIWRERNLAETFDGENAVSTAAHAAEAGDMIIVYPGEYTDTTDRSQGLAADSVDYYFFPKAVVTKESGNDSAIFKILDGWAQPTNVYGSGTFKSDYYTYYNNSDADAQITFEFDSIKVTSSYAIYMNRGTVDLKLKTRGNVLLSAVSGIYLKRSHDADIDIATIKVTGGDGIYIKSATATINSTYISGSAHGIYVTKQGMVNTTSKVVANVSYCSGTTYGLFNASCDVVFNGVLNSCRNIWGGASLIVNGFAGTVENGTGDTRFVGGCGSLTNTSGVAIVTSNKISYNTQDFLSINVSGGDVSVHDSRLRGNQAISGGDVIFYGDNDLVLQYGKHFNLSGGNLIINGSYEKVEGNYNYYLVEQSGGNLYLKGKLENSYSDTADGEAGCVKITGGDLFIDGAIMTADNDSAYAITATDTVVDIYVLAGGLSLAEETFTARKQNIRFQVHAVDSVQLNIGDSTYTLHDVATYNTKDSIAQKMTDTINASAGDWKAYQDNAGTDDYFYVRSTVAGTEFSYSSNGSGVYTRLTEAIIRENNATITNSTGGTVITDTNVD